MLELALKAQLPLIAATTRDIVNLTSVITSLTKKTAIPFQPNDLAFKKGALYYFVMEKEVILPLSKFYDSLSKVEASLLLINPKRIVEPMFDAGEIPVPKKLLGEFLAAVVPDPKSAETLIRGLGGCTIKEAAELCRLTMARDGSLTVPGLMATRRSSFQAYSGLTQVDTADKFYDAPSGLVEYAAREKAFFLNGSDPRLIPRGLLMDGPPGTGKTAGAKWLARQWGIPLYRVDIGGTKDKYMGMSEANMLTNLARLDREEPCVALLDEVEKVFDTSHSDSSGTTSTMLSQLLWWLAERRSRVFVMMTTNNAEALPKELYREGRIDATMRFEGLVGADAAKFIVSVLATFDKKSTAGINALDILNKTPPINQDAKQKRYAQSALTTGVYNFVKNAQIAKS